MAYIRESAGFGGYSGRVGNVVYAETQGGTIMRSRPLGSTTRTEPQRANDDRKRLAHSAWEALSDDEVQAWRAYARERAAASPRGSKQRMTSGWNLFSGLATKYLQVHGGRAVPSLPPTGRFLGDLLEVTVESLPGALRFTSDGSSRPGVLTEILMQRLKNRNNETRPKSYVSLAFVTFEAGVPVEIPVPLPGYAALAVRYVEASSGRMTNLIEIGRALASPDGGTATL